MKYPFREISHIITPLGANKLGPRVFLATSKGFAVTKQILRCLARRKAFTGQSQTMERTVEDVYFRNCLPHKPYSSSIQFRQRDRVFQAKKPGEHCLRQYGISSEHLENWWCIQRRSLPEPFKTWIKRGQDNSTLTKLQVTRQTWTIDDNLVIVIEMVGDVCIQGMIEVRGMLQFNSADQLVCAEPRTEGIKLLKQGNENTKKLDKFTRRYPWVFNPNPSGKAKPHTELKESENALKAAGISSEAFNLLLEWRMFDHPTYAKGQGWK